MSLTSCIRLTIWMVFCYTCEFVVTSADIYRTRSVNQVVLTIRYGVVLKQRGHMSKASEVFREAVNQFPCNWSAWLELALTMTNLKAVRTMQAGGGLSRSDFPFLSH
jgi:hypothetical protein